MKNSILIPASIGFTLAAGAFIFQTSNAIKDFADNAITNPLNGAIAATKEEATLSNDTNCSEISDYIDGGLCAQNDAPAVLEKYEDLQP